MSQDLPTKLHKTSPFPNYPPGNDHMGPTDFGKFGKSSTPQKCRYWEKDMWVRSREGTKHHLNKSQFQKNDDRNSETQPTFLNNATFSKVLCLGQCLGWKSSDPGGCRFPEVDFYFSGGYEKPSNFIGDIWIFMEGWWDNREFQVRVVVQYISYFYPENFWGNESQFDTHIFSDGLVETSN